MILGKVNYFDGSCRCCRKTACKVWIYPASHCLCYDTSYPWGMPHWTLYFVWSLGASTSHIVITEFILFLVVPTSRHVHTWKERKPNIIYIYNHPRTHSPKVAFHGVWPNVAHDGQTLDPARLKKANKRMVESWAVVEFRGDWKWHKEWFGLSRFYNYKCAGLCHMCTATNKPGNLQFLSYKYVSTF